MPREDATPTPEEQAAAAAQVPAPAPAEPVQDLPSQGVGPWMSDLQALGLDDAALSSVDSYLRTSWQPRVTQLEQSQAALKPAQELYADLIEDPRDTYIAIAEELYGEDVAEKVAGLLQPEDTAQTVPPAQTTAQPLDPRVEAVVTHFERDQDAKDYAKAKAEVLAQPQNADVDADLLDPFVAAAEGDWDVAVGAYRNYFARVKEKLGVPVVDPAEVPAAPPALGSGSASTTAPPVQKQHATLDEALDDFFAEQRAAPPTVGAV